MGKGKADEGGCVGCQVSSCNCLIVLLILTLFGYGVAKIFMGSVYIHDCQIEKKIPIYLIVSGVAPILFAGFRRKEEGEGTSLGALICGVLGVLFNIAWVICGSNWVYSNAFDLKTVDFTRCEGSITIRCRDNICDKNLFNFALVSSIKKKGSLSRKKGQHVNNESVSNNCDIIYQHVKTS